MAAAYDYEVELVARFFDPENSFAPVWDAGLVAFVSWERSISGEDSLLMLTFLVFNDKVPHQRIRFDFINIPQRYTLDREDYMGEFLMPVQAISPNNYMVVPYVPNDVQVSNITGTHMVNREGHSARNPTYFFKDGPEDVVAIDATTPPPGANVRFSNREAFARLVIPYRTIIGMFTHEWTPRGSLRMFTFENTGRSSTQGEEYVVMERHLQEADVDEAIRVILGMEEGEPGYSPTSPPSSPTVLRTPIRVQMRARLYDPREMLGRFHRITPRSQMEMMMLVSRAYYPPLDNAKINIVTILVYATNSSALARIDVFRKPRGSFNTRDISFPERLSDDYVVATMKTYYRSSNRVRGHLIKGMGHTTSEGYQEIIVKAGSLHAFVGTSEVTWVEEENQNVVAHVSPRDSYVHLKISARDLQRLFEYIERIGRQVGETRPLGPVLIFRFERDEGTEDRWHTDSSEYGTGDMVDDAIRQDFREMTMRPPLEEPVVIDITPKEEPVEDMPPLEYWSDEEEGRRKRQFEEVDRRLVDLALVDQ